MEDPRYQVLIGFSFASSWLKRAKRATVLRVLGIILWAIFAEVEVNVHNICTCSRQSAFVAARSVPCVTRISSS